MENKEQRLLDFLASNENVNKATISKAIDFNGLALYNLLKRMVMSGSITETESDGENVYNLTEKQHATKNEEPTEKELNKEETARLIITKKGKDSTKYKFNGELYGKGPVVRAIVEKYVEDHPATIYDELKEVFPDALMKRFGIFQDEATAKRIAPKGRRYFDKPEQVIKLADRDIVVCNQFTAENIVPFLDRTAELGYVPELHVFISMNRKCVN